MENLVPLADDWRPAEAVVAPLQRTDRPAVGALAAILAADLAIFLYVIVAGLVRQPFSDMFDFLKAEFDWERSGDLLAYLAAPHNGQHLVWVRVLTAIDVQAFNGSGTVFMAAAALSIFGAAALLGFEIVRSTPGRMAGALAALLAAPLIVSTINAIDCTQPINSVYAIAFGFAVASVILFERIETEAGARVWLFAAAAFLAGLAAVAGSAASVAVFPALIVSAARNRSVRGLLAPTLLVGVLALAAVFGGLLAAQQPQASAGGTGHLLKMADYFVVYTGMPWSSVGPLSRLRLVIGLATILVGGVLLWRGSRRHGAAGRLERIGLDLILFALITAALAAVGRADETAAVIVPLRYALFMSAFQVGIMCLAAPVIAERWDRLKRYAVPAALALALALLGQQLAGAASTLRTSQMIRADIAAFTAGQRRADLHQTIHPDFDVALQIQAECRQRGLYR